MKMAGFEEIIPLIFVILFFLGPHIIRMLGAKERLPREGEKEGKPEPGVPVPSGPKPLTKVFVDCEVPYSEFFNFFQGVIKPLGSNSDRIKLNISIEAQKSEGFNPNVIEDTVKETLHSIFNSDDAFRGE